MYFIISKVISKRKGERKEDEERCESIGAMCAMLNKVDAQAYREVWKYQNSQFDSNEADNYDNMNRYYDKAENNEGYEDYDDEIGWNSGGHQCCTTVGAAGLPRVVHFV